MRIENFMRKMRVLAPAIAMFAGGPCLSQSVCDPALTGGFAPGGLEGPVLALEAFDPDGPGGRDAMLIAGGQFRRAVNGATDNAATQSGLRRLEAGKWVRFGADVEGEVHALRAIDPDGPGPKAQVLFVGGEFETAGGKRLHNIGMWDGEVWTDLAGGVNGRVLDIASFDEDGAGPKPPVVVVAGRFTHAGDDEFQIEAPYLARWDGQAWSGFGAIEPYDVLPGIETLLVLDEDGIGPLDPSLFVAGRVRTINGVNVRSIARWDGAHWSALGDGLNGPVFTLAGFDADGAGPAPARLFAGGFFNASGESPQQNIAMWDGQSWQIVGGGLISDVIAMEAWDPDGAGPQREGLYVGGYFAATGDLFGVRRIGRWDGKQWSKLGEGLRIGPCLALKAHDPDGAGPAPEVLIAGGDFTRAGDAGAKYLAQWDGDAWRSVGAPTDGWVRSFGTFVPDGASGAASLIVGGDFTSIEGVQANRIAQRTATGWSPLGAGLGGGQLPFVGDMLSLDIDGPGPIPTSLFVVGQFSRAGEVDAINIARWDGAKWHDVGQSIAGSGLELAAFDEDGPGSLPPRLFIGGNISAAGGESKGRLVRWDGLEYTVVGTGEGAVIEAMIVADLDGDGPAPEALYYITPTSFIMWDGQSLVPLGPDPEVSATDLIAFDADGDGPEPPRLIVTGEGGVNVWNGGAWIPFGAEFPLLDTAPSVLACFDADGDGALPHRLIAGGAFFADFEDRPIRQLAQWDGDAWRPFGLGTNHDVLALMPFDADGAGPAPAELWVGGRFTAAAGVPSGALARVRIDESGAPPIITHQPESRFPGLGGTAIFEVQAIGDGPLSYQWRHRGQPVQDVVGVVSGATSPRLVFQYVRAPDRGTYDVVVANACGETISQRVVLVRVLGCTGDLLETGFVDVFDLNVVLNNFGGLTDLGPADGDADNDGDVDMQDLNIVLGAFGTMCDLSNAP